jgi:multicomponent K+:H+ antiporter subunit A
MSLALLLALPFIGSAIAALLPSNARNAESTWSAAVAAAALVRVAAMFPQVRDGGVIRETIAWIPSAGLDLTIRVDGFAWMFAMLVTGIGLLVILYARYYMSPADPVPRFFAFLLAFMGAMLGLVTSGNLIQLVFFWELTSLTSFMLIGYWHHRADARRGARMALLVTGAGGLCLFAGALLIGRIVGSYDLDAVLGAGARLRADPLYRPMLALVLIGAFTKSAQFPFHFWLPHAMAAPTPVSAYLHSATMVKAGVFLLARLWPALAGTPEWFWVVGGAGLCTLVMGAYAAMFQHDLKGLLAYSTISHLGLITLLLGLDSPLAAVAAVFHIINHATFKAALFMAAGVIDHETGTRDIERLNGLFKAMPITATLAMVASAAMAGVPLLNGFLSKEMFFAETVYVASNPWIEWGLPIAATIAGIFAVVYALRFSVDIFFGKPSDDLPRSPHEPSRWMRVPIELLVLACLVVGIFPAQSIGPALAAAASPVVGGSLPDYDLALWHGVNAPLVMSVLAMTGGAFGYAWLRRQLARGRFRQPPLVGRLDGKSAFESLLARSSLVARRALEFFSTRRLQPQLFLLALIGVLAPTAAMWADGIGWGSRPRVPASPEFVAFSVIGIVCAIAATLQAKYHRLAALTMLGVVGLVVCLTFVWFSAPDLALTQLVVEVVTLVLFLLGLRWLPKPVVADDPAPIRVRIRRARDLVLALIAGTGMAGLSYAMLTRPAPQSISPYFLDQALPGGGGANVINVMLVDFRAFDTLGEITVLGVVALTVYALLRRFRPPRESARLPRQQEGSHVAADLVHPHTTPDTLPGYMLVPAVLVRWLLPVAGIIAAYLFLRGHDEPGGGFVAGLVVAIALVTQYLVAGTQWVEARLELNPLRWIALGLLAAVGTGAGAIGVGYPFLTTHTAHIDVPALGVVHVPSAMFLDIGIFAVVVGSTLLILIALAHQSLRGGRLAAQAADEDATADVR